MEALCKSACFRFSALTVWITQHAFISRIFHHVVVANWKHITSYESHVGMRQIVWRDRSLVLNFLFGLRR